MRHTSRMLVALLVPMVAACAEVTEPLRGEVQLESLRFMSGASDVGESLVLMGQARAGSSDTPIAIDSGALTVESSSGNRVRAQLQRGSPYRQGARSTPWSMMSDEQLTQAIAKAPRDIVFIGFKEAGALRGVDEDGTVLCSEETEAEVKAWVMDQGISIEREPVYVPAVAATMPADLELVKEVRYHPNVDYLEPNTTGEYTSTADVPESSAGPFDWFVAVVSTTLDGGAGLGVSSGDEITATYRQPDGSVLTATTRIR